MSILCSRHSFNVFSISERLPILPRPDLVFVTEWMNVLKKRNTKINKITNTGSVQTFWCWIQDFCQTSQSQIMIFFTQTEQGLRVIFSTVRSVQVRLIHTSNRIWLGNGWKREESSSYALERTDLEQLGAIQACSEVIGYPQKPSTFPLL